MAKIINFARWVRNNWKKSTFLTIACYYGSNYVKTEYEKNSLVRQYCQKVVKYGEAPLPVFQSPRHILVILNPTANKKKAKKEFDKYCAPLLHLSGAKVTLLSTSSEYNATQLSRGISDDVDAVVVAGGDGTISEVVTGIFLQKSTNELQRDVPLGIIPLGRNNILANNLYSSSNTSRNSSLDRLKLMMDATYSIVQEVTAPLNVIESNSLVQDENPTKPRYSLNYLQWGAFRDVTERVDKYWYFGGLRQLAAYVFGSRYNTNFQMEIKYTPPCTGCSKCYKYRLDKMQKKGNPVSKRWWHAFVPRSTAQDPKPIVIDYEKIINENCDQFQEKIINTVELIVSSRDHSGVPSLHVQIGPESVSYFDFVKEGWSREHVGISSLKNEEHEAQNLFIIPHKSQDEKTFFSIDNEAQEIVPLRISLLHKVLPVFSCHC